MKYKIWKKAAGAALAFTLAITAGMPLMPHAQETEEPQIIEEPEITLHNISIMGGETSYLWNNTMGASDFDFKLDDSSDAWIEYNFNGTAKVDGLELIGWWPKDQSIKTMSIYYYQENEWKPVQERLEVPWVTSQGSNGSSAEFGGGEKLRIPFADIVTTARLKIQIHEAYHSWSEKVNMRLLAPTGEVVNNLKPLTEAIQSLENYLTGLLVGELPGEFPQTAVDELNKVLENAKQAAGNPDLTDAQMQEEVAKINAAREAFLASQNPLPEEGRYAVSLENLTVLEGKTSYLMDQQMVTGVKLAETGNLENSGIVFDFGQQEVLLSELEILCEDPLNAGIKNVDVEYFDGASWQNAAAGLELGWKGGFAACEGRSAILDTPVRASRFRLKINETNGKAGYTLINEINLKTQEVIAPESLEELAAKAEEMIKAAADQESAEVDRVKLKLMSARNPDTLSRADQKKIDFLKTELRAAMNQLDESLKDKIPPTEPSDLKVEQAGQRSVTFSFLPSRDNVGVVGYKVYSGNAVIADIPNTLGENQRVTAEVTGLSEGTAYTLVVKAYDAEGNLSPGADFSFETEKEEGPATDPSGPPADSTDPAVPDPLPNPDTEPAPQEPQPMQKPEKLPDGSQNLQSPKTGDNSNLFGISILLFLSTVGMATAVMRTKEQRT